MCVCVLMHADPYTTYKKGHIHVDLGTLFISLLEIGIFLALIKTVKEIGKTDEKIGKLIFLMELMTGLARQGKQKHLILG